MGCCSTSNHIFCRLLPRQYRNGGFSFINLSVFANEVEAEENETESDQFEQCIKILEITPFLM